MSVPASRPDPQIVERAVEQVGGIVLGKAPQIRLALACLLAQGHLLIEDIPGVGKTTLAHALALTLGLQFQRIQFTSDLLPTDILGVSIYSRSNARLEFHPGPIFAQLVLADEVNRATPKSQSALLEAMEERQVTVEGATRALPRPFFVIATQNPAHQIGTFPLPESQLDRFLMRVQLGYPDGGAERDLLQGIDRRELLARSRPALLPDDVQSLQQGARQVHASDALLDYLQAILRYTREPGRYVQGLSPRAGQALLRSAQAWAYVHGRGYVLPEDVQATLEPVVAHRLHRAREPHAHGEDIAAEIMAEVALP